MSQRIARQTRIISTNHAVPAAQAVAQQPDGASLARDLAFGALVYLSISHFVAALTDAYEYYWSKPENEAHDYWIIWLDLALAIGLGITALLLLRFDNNGEFRRILDSFIRSKRKHRDNRSCTHDEDNEL